MENFGTGDRINITYALVPYAHARITASVRATELIKVYRPVGTLRRILETAGTVGDGRYEIQQILSIPTTRLLDDISNELNVASQDDRIYTLRASVEEWFANLQNTRKQSLKQSVWGLFESVSNSDDLDYKYNAVAAFSCLVDKARSLWEDKSGGHLVREISFAPEHQQAGISILSYFAVILRQRLPDVRAAVSIQQHADSITLTISYPDGKEENITQVLSEYGMVVTGELDATALLADPLQVLALKNKLQMADLELRQTRELLSLERTYSESRFSTLQEDVAYLRNALATQLSGAEDTRRRLLDAAERNNALAQSAAAMALIPEIINAIINRDETQLRQRAQSLKEEDPDVFLRLSAFLYSSGVSGVVGNACYDWLKVLWPIIPK